MHGLRAEYQERINFVILDVDDREDGRLARLLGYRGTPAYLLIAPDSAEVLARVYGVQHGRDLRNILDSLAARFGS